MRACFSRCARFVDCVVVGGAPIRFDRNDDECTPTVLLGPPWMIGMAAGLENAFSFGRKSAPVQPKSSASTPATHAHRSPYWPPSPISLAPGPAKLAASYTATAGLIHLHP